MKTIPQLQLTRALRLCGTFIAVLAGCLAAGLAPTQAAQNVLLIIADDYGADSSALYNSTNSGASLPPTPNIEALARGGVLFRHAYANPSCSPTRACIMTGRHAFRHGIGFFIRSDALGATDPLLTLAEFTLPDAFGANAALGYQLAQFGKWHLAGWSFEQTHSQVNADAPNLIGGWPHFAGSLGGSPRPSYTNWIKVVNGTQTPGYSNYATTDVVDDAVAWIQARGSQPWFTSVAFNAGHIPFHKPPNQLHSYDNLPGTTEDINANPRPYFEAMIEAMDTEIGRLLSAVDRANTHIVFIGDNGTPAGVGGPNVLQPPYPSGRGKSTLYEGGTRVPLIIAGPAVTNPGRTNATLVHAVDLFATILELAGINVAATVPASTTVDSQSLLPVLQGATDASRCVYAEQFRTNSPTADDGRTLRNGQFKLIRFDSGLEEFYDLLADPYEGTNLLGRSLSAIQQANYYALTIKLGNYQDELVAPVITSFARAASQFSVTVPRETNLAYRLWRASALDGLAWVPVANALVVTNGTATVTLTDTDAVFPTASDGSDWRPFTFTGVAGGTRLYIFMESAGDLHIDDIALVAGTVPRVGSNYVQNGGFESLPFTSPGPWRVSGNHSNSTVSSVMRFEGMNSLHVIASAAGGPTSSVYQDLAGIITTNVYTLSLRYLPTTNGQRVTVRLASGFRPSIDVRPIQPLQLYRVEARSR